MAYQILVVEDEPDTRELLEYLLRWAGHHVHVTASGREALERLAIRSYDVILSDLHMPGMSGEDLYRRIGDAELRAAPGRARPRRWICRRPRTPHRLPGPPAICCREEPARSRSGFEYAT